MKEDVLLLIKEFMTRYEREYDFFSQAARLVNERLDDAFSSAGIRAITSYRAKRPSSLETKLRERAEEKAYQNDVDIYNDIVDMAGARVALYFPSDLRAVERLIQSNFELSEEPRRFPKAGKSQHYTATHFRVRLNRHKLEEHDRRYAASVVEIQVASVLMHAWAEVEHDLKYKPGSVKISGKEDEILHNLGALVRSGEQMLVDLGAAGSARTTGQAYFPHVFDLSMSLRRELNIQDLESLGDLNLLYRFAYALGFAKPGALTKYYYGISVDKSQMSVAKQIIANILSEDPKRFLSLIKVQMSDRGDPANWSPREKMHWSDRLGAAEAIAKSWVGMTAFANHLVSSHYIENNKYLLNDDPTTVDRVFGKNGRHIIETARTFCEMLINGFWLFDPGHMRGNAMQLMMLFNQAKNHADEPVQKAAAVAFEAIEALA